MSVPTPTWILRILPVENLMLYLRRGGLHEANCAPPDGLVYQTIHNVEIQQLRREFPVPCGPGGVLFDYVPFYFGPRSPMLLQLHTGRVRGYHAGQEPLIYLCCNAQDIQGKGLGFVFSDGHGIKRFTHWFSDLADLTHVDWDSVLATQWHDTPEQPDRQRRKQAEFLVHQFCPWDLVRGIVVMTETMKKRVELILAEFPAEMVRPVAVRPDWYY